MTRRRCCHWRTGMRVPTQGGHKGTVWMAVTVGCRTVSQCDSIVSIRSHIQGPAVMRVSAWSAFRWDVSGLRPKEGTSRWRPSRRLQTSAEHEGSCSSLEPIATPAPAAAHLALQLLVCVSVCKQATGATAQCHFASGLSPTSSTSTASIASIPPSTVMDASAGQTQRD